MVADYLSIHFSQASSLGDQWETHCLERDQVLGLSEPFALVKNSVKLVDCFQNSIQELNNLIVIFFIFFWENMD